MVSACHQIIQHQNKEYFCSLSIVAQILIRRADSEQNLMATRFQAKAVLSTTRQMNSTRKKPGKNRCIIVRSRLFRLRLIRSFPLKFCIQSTQFQQQMMCRRNAFALESSSQSASDQQEYQTARNSVPGYVANIFITGSFRSKNAGQERSWRSGSHGQLQWRSMGESGSVRSVAVRSMLILLLLLQQADRYSCFPLKQRLILASKLLSRPLSSLLEESIS